MIRGHNVNIVNWKYRWNRAALRAIGAKERLIFKKVINSHLSSFLRPHLKPGRTYGDRI